MKSQVTMVLRGLCYMAAVLACLLFGYGIVVYYYRVTPQITYWPHAAFEQKERIAQSKNQPKIVLLGASDVMMGLSAKQIESVTGIPTVNFAVWAELKEYTLHRAKRILSPGDVVILPYTYKLLWSNHKKAFMEQTMRERYILTYDMAYFDSLPWWDQLHTLLIGFDDLWRNHQTTFGQQTYDVITLNEWGDETINTVATRVSGDESVKPLGIPNDFFTVFPSYDGVGDLLEFVQWCKEHDIRLVITYPVIQYFSDYETTEAYERFFVTVADLYATLGVDVLGTPADFFYDETLFWQPPVYVHQQGALLWTTQVIEELRVMGIIN